MRKLTEQVPPEVPPSPVLQTVEIMLPTVEAHPNRVPFQGCLTMIGVPSDKAPSGARGHRVLLTQEAAARALPGLLGMAVCFHNDWNGHNARQKCGIITMAELSERSLNVEGFIFGRDFPELDAAPANDQLGMSYELADAHIADMRQKIWTITRCTFTGAAVLMRDKAAYRSTSFRWLGNPPKAGAEKPKVPGVAREIVSRHHFTPALCADRNEQ